MKGKIVLLVAMATGALSLLAAGPWTGKKVSVLGDSYSTFEGVSGDAANVGWQARSAADENNPFYPGDLPEVANEYRTWWRRAMATLGGTLEVNASVGGSEVARDVGSSVGISRDARYLIRSFANRASNGALGSPDVILVFGGTNDGWNGVPEPVFRAGVTSLFATLRDGYPGAKVYVILPDLKTDATVGVAAAYRSAQSELAATYGYTVIDLHDSDVGLSSGDYSLSHPKDSGMQKIAAKVVKSVYPNAPAAAAKTVSAAADATAGVIDVTVGPHADADYILLAVWGTADGGNTDFYWGGNWSKAKTLAYLPKTGITTCTRWTPFADTGVGVRYFRFHLLPANQAFMCNLDSVGGTDPDQQYIDTGCQLEAKSIVVIETAVSTACMTGKKTMLDVVPANPSVKHVVCDFYLNNGYPTYNLHDSTVTGGNACDARLGTARAPTENTRLTLSYDALRENTKAVFSYGDDKATGISPVPTVAPGGTIRIHALGDIKKLYVGTMTSGAGDLVRKADYHMAMGYAADGRYGPGFFDSTRHQFNLSSGAKSFTAGEVSASYSKDKLAGSTIVAHTATVTMDVCEPLPAPEPEISDYWEGKLKFAPAKTIVCYGDSLTAGTMADTVTISADNYFDGRMNGVSGAESYPYQLAKMIPGEYNVIAQARGSRTTDAIVSWAGGVPVKSVSPITLPAAADTEVSAGFPNFLYNGTDPGYMYEHYKDSPSKTETEKNYYYGLQIPDYALFEANPVPGAPSGDVIPGWFGGVHVRLHHTRANERTISRTEAGAAVTVPAGSAFVPDSVVSLRDSVAVFFAGSNDRSLERKDAVIAMLRDGVANYARHVVLSPYEEGFLAAGETSYQTTPTGFEREMAAAFEDHYLNLRLELATRGLDLAVALGRMSPAQAAGKTWREGLISSDGVHLSSAGYAVLARLVKEKLQQLAYLPAEPDPQHEHTPVAVPAVAATYATPGRTAGTKCSACGEVLSAGEETPVIASRPTCSARIAADGQAKLTFANVLAPVVVSVVYGDEDRGEEYFRDADWDGGKEPCGWDHWEVVAFVPAGTTSYEDYVIPGWGTTATHARFLVTPYEQTPKATLETIIATDPAGQILDTGVSPDGGTRLNLTMKLGVDPANKTLVDTPSDAAGALAYGISFDASRHPVYAYDTATYAVGAEAANGSDVRFYMNLDESGKTGWRTRIGGTSYYAAGKPSAPSTKTTDGTIRIYGLGTFSPVTIADAQGATQAYFAPVTGFDAEGNEVVGFLDTVSMTLHASAGSAAFAKGPAHEGYHKDLLANVTILTATATIGAGDTPEPEPAYGELFDYLQTDGAGYIRTGVVPNLRTTRVEMTFVLTHPEKDQTLCFASEAVAGAAGGTAVAGNGNEFGLAYYAELNFGTKTSPDKQPGFQYYCEGLGEAKFLKGFADSTGKHTFAFGGGTLKVDGGEIATTGTPNDGSAGGELVLFTTTFGKGLTNFADARIYSVRIYESDVLTHDYRPCTDKSGKAGLWDAKTNEVLLPTTDGFVAANETADAWTQPAADTPAAIANALAADGFDAVTQTAFADLEALGAFKAYCVQKLGLVNPMDESKAGVKANALLGYALGAETVPNEAISSDDVKIDSIARDAGSVVVTVSVRGFAPQDKASVKSVLNAVVSATGGESLTEMSAGNVSAEGRVQNDVLSVSVEPKQSGADAFFVRVVIRN